MDKPSAPLNTIQTPLIQEGEVQSAPIPDEGYLTANTNPNPQKWVNRIFSRWCIILYAICLLAVVGIALGLALGFRSSTPKKQEDLQMQAETLQIFRRSLEDPEQLNSWTGDDPCDGWKGISCENGRIVGVQYSVDLGLDYVGSFGETSIPPEFSRLGHLQKLLLNYDQITGTIPAELSVLDMEAFEVSKHFLHGTLPPELSVWTGLRVLNLDSSIISVDRISGDLPVEYSTWENLLAFVIASNNIDGKFPIEFSAWKSIASLVTADNLMSGTLPQEYSLWDQIQQVQIFHNNVSGEVPEEYSTWRNAKILFFGPQEDYLCIDQELQTLLEAVPESDVRSLPVC
eukprot:TRINITY_DN2009_c0_g1_i2.p1 TRINITY_DN2009_c0_g1~~TRINITY_DN2009_c0_g1_i2.p1  ORF type:complete len:383 (-),score=32.88 TRINITY_DN2009_c0_g1_i2:2598-3629(-)